ncbi:MAG: DUF393 domain-containing protein [Paracoccus sp. (in: a-proteobacteria)]|nr:DUF393 domain-containing protein [Paracoccus sp. (in: a-proteobacteria)]
MENTVIEIVYDGECPFCADFTRMVALARMGRVDLIDARGPDPRVALIGAGLDLDQGMAVRHLDRIYFGADAVTLLLALSAPTGPAGRIMRWLFATPRRARLTYPLLRAGRALTLRLMGRGPLAKK